MSKYVGTGPLSYKKEFIGLRSHESWETLFYTLQLLILGMQTLAVVLQTSSVESRDKYFAVESYYFCSSYPQ
jgi:hypothetical protein